MYDEVRRGIPKHTACAVIPQAVRLSVSEYGEVCDPAATRGRCQLGGVHYCSVIIILCVMGSGKSSEENL